MTRYATTVYNRHLRVLSALSSVFSRAECFHFTADKLTEETQKVWLSDDARRLPAVERAYLRGRVDAWRDAIWRYKVDWRLGPASGWTRKVHEPWTAEMSELSRTKQIYGGHFWCDTNHAFTEYKQL